ncbi:MAG: hypothetical protein GY815_10160 [Gammaproteobacteria bacterium]|nr:hypothetical protein [Gammaproteobacteria bacterium]
MSYFKVFIYALLTAPLILFNVSHASTYTTGDLQYNSLTGVITNQQTQQTYLGWDLISSYTYQDTVDATANGGLYSGYHIADFDEAKTFFEAAMDGTCVVTSDAVINTCHTPDNYYNGFFGDNHGYTTDSAFFLGSNAGRAGIIELNELNLHFNVPHRLFDWGSISASDSWSHSGYQSHVPVSWLLVANTTSTVPVPAAIWLFGTALIGLVGYGKRKSKVPV